MPVQLRSPGFKKYLSGFFLSGNNLFEFYLLRSFICQVAQCEGATTRSCQQHYEENERNERPLPGTIQNVDMKID